jgi:hypothetical protein
MSKQVSPEDILAGAPAEVDLEKQLVLEQLAFQKLQRRRLEKQDAEEQEQEAMKLRARLEAARNLEKARKDQEAIQSVCPHLKPNGQPSIAGQRDHQRNHIFICAYCQKLFDQHTLPPHLRIDSQRVGGPD